MKLLREDDYHYLNDLVIYYQMVCIMHFICNCSKSNFLPKYHVVLLSLNLEYGKKIEKEWKRCFISFASVLTNQGS